MIDLMMSAEQDVIALLERLTGGPLDEFDCADELAGEAYFAMAGSNQAIEAAQRASR